MPSKKSVPKRVRSNASLPVTPGAATGLRLAVVSHAVLRVLSTGGHEVELVANGPCLLDVEFDSTDQNAVPEVSCSEQPDPPCPPGCQGGEADPINPAPDDCDRAWNLRCDCEDAVCADELPDLITKRIANGFPVQFGLIILENRLSKNDGKLAGFRLMIAMPIPGTQRITLFRDLDGDCRVSRAPNLSKVREAKTHFAKTRTNGKQVMKQLSVHVQP